MAVSSLEGRVGSLITRVRTMPTYMKVGMAGLVGMGVGIAGLKVIGSTADAARDFQKEIVNVGAVTKATASEFASLRQQAIKLGIETWFDPAQAAQGMYELASAGLSVNQVIGASEPVLRIAAIGQMSMSDAAMTAAAAMKAWNKDAKWMEHATDAMTRATQLSMLKMHEFGGAIGNVGGQAYIANQSFESTIALLGIMRDLGMPAQDAATRLAAAYRHLDAPVQRAHKAFDRMNAALKKHGMEILNFRNAEGKLKPFVDIVDQLMKVEPLMDPDEFRRDLLLMLGAEGLQAYFATVARGTDEVRKLTDAYIHALGTAKEYTDKLLATWDKIRELFRGTVQTIKVVLGEPVIGMLSAFVPKVTNTLNTVLRFLATRPKLVKYMMTAATAGTVFITVAGGLAFAISALGFVMKGLAASSLAATHGLRALSTQAVATVPTMVGLTAATAANSAAMATNTVQWAGYTVPIIGASSALKTVTTGTVAATTNTASLGTMLGTLGSKLVVSAAWAGIFAIALGSVAFAIDRITNKRKQIDNTMQSLEDMWRAAGLSEKEIEKLRTQWRMGFESEMLEGTMDRFRKEYEFLFAPERPAGIYGGAGGIETIGPWEDWQRGVRRFVRESEAELEKMRTLHVPEEVIKNFQTFLWQIAYQTGMLQPGVIPKEKRELLFGEHVIPKKPKVDVSRYMSSKEYEPRRRAIIPTETVVRESIAQQAPAVQQQGEQRVEVSVYNYFQSSGSEIDAERLERMITQAVVDSLKRDPLNVGSPVAR
jgi:TP901 family phage tail tape measure protein